MSKLNGKKMTEVARIWPKKHYGNMPLLDKHIYHAPTVLKKCGQTIDVWERCKNKIDKMWYKNLTDCRRAVAIDLGLDPNIVEFKEVHALYDYGK